MTGVAVMLFTRDLRVHDNPALVAAAAARRTVPLFVLSADLITSGAIGAYRLGALRDALRSLDAALHSRGCALHLRVGDPVDEVLAVCRQSQAHELHLASDVTPRAKQRLEALQREATHERLRVVVHDGITHCAPGDLTPATTDAYVRFTPYYRRWLAHTSRPLAPDLRLQQAINLDGAARTRKAWQLLETHASTPPRGDGGETRARAPA